MHPSRGAAPEQARYALPAESLRRLYLSENAGEEWINIQGTLPSEFGFPIALDAHHPETLFVIVEGDGRNNISDHFTVYRAPDAGGSWESLTNGLPSGANVRLGVLRHGMCADALDPCGVYVGTNTGQLYATAVAAIAGRWSPTICRRSTR